MGPGIGVCQINIGLLTGVFYPFLRGLSRETIFQDDIVVINKSTIRSGKLDSLLSLNYNITAYTSTVEGLRGNVVLATNDLGGFVPISLMQNTD